MSIHIVCHVFAICFLLRTHAIVIHMLIWRHAYAWCDVGKVAAKGPVGKWWYFQKQVKQVKQVKEVKQVIFLHICCYLQYFSGLEA